MNQNNNKKFFLTAAGWKINCFSGSFELPEEEFKKEKFFLKDFNNFGRLDEMSKSVCVSIAALLKSHGLYPNKEKLQIQIIFSNPEGPITSDIKYYNDFLEFEETAGRANLFVYTLPTSPLGEASVHFGLTGNIVYLTSDNSLESMCNVVLNTDEKRFLVGLGEFSEGNTNALFMLFEEKKDSSRFTVEEVAKLEFDSLADLKNKLLRI